MKTISRSLVLSVISLFMAIVVHAQDIVVTVDSKSIKAKVLEINDQEIKYKDFENLEGPTYVMKRTDVHMIVYQNGKVETFEPMVYNQNDYYDNTYYDDQNTTDSNYIDPNFRILSYDQLMSMYDEDKLYYLSTLNETAIYDKFNLGQQLSRNGYDLRNAGIFFSSFGGTLFLLGQFAFGNQTPEGTILTGIGSASFFAGQGFILISIPFSAVGGAFKHSAENMYQDFTLGKSYTIIQPKLNFGLTQNGVGLSLKF